MNNFIYELPPVQRYKSRWLSVAAATEHVMSSAEDWDMTLLAVEYKYRFRGQSDPVFLYQFAEQHGARVPEKYPTGKRYVVLWHGTTLWSAKKILEKGFRKKKAIWMTTNPRMARGMAVGKANGLNDGIPAILVSVMDTFMYERGVDYTFDGSTVYVFHRHILPDVIEYLVAPDGIRYVGQKGNPVALRIRPEKSGWLRALDT